MIVHRCFSKSKDSDEKILWSHNQKRALLSECPHHENPSPTSQLPVMRQSSAIATWYGNESIQNRCQHLRFALLSFSLNKICSRGDPTTYLNHDKSSQSEKQPIFFYAEGNNADDSNGGRSCSFINFQDPEILSIRT